MSATKTPWIVWTEGRAYEIYRVIDGGPLGPRIGLFHDREDAEHVVELHNNSLKEKS